MHDLSGLPAAVLPRQRLVPRDRAPTSGQLRLWVLRAGKPVRLPGVGRHLYWLTYVGPVLSRASPEGRRPWPYRWNPTGPELRRDWGGVADPIIPVRYLRIRPEGSAVYAELHIRGWGISTKEPGTNVVDVSYAIKIGGRVAQANKRQIARAHRAARMILNLASIGRPEGSGQYDRVDEFRADFAEAVNQVRRMGLRITTTSVINEMPLQRTAFYGYLGEFGLDFDDEVERALGQT